MEALAWLGGGFVVCAVIGLMLWRAAKRSGVERAVRDIQESTDIATDELKRQAKIVRDAGVTDDRYLD